MSSSTSDGDRVSRDSEERDVEPRPDPDLIVELLGDGNLVELFLAASAPMTVEELASACDLSSSTAYRKVAKLEEADLLVQTNPGASSSTTPAYYIRSIDEITVTLGNELRVDLCSS